MGKFDGFLICSDVDSTLTYEAGKVSDENAKAIKYFQDEGGLFTLATGRAPSFMEHFSDKVKINAPVVSFKGALLYDTEKDELIKKDSKTEKWIRKYSMGVEFINNIPRYCLWLKDIKPNELNSMPLIKKRVVQCKEWRENSVKTGDAYKLRRCDLEGENKVDITEWIYVSDLFAVEFSKDYTIEKYIEN